MDVWKRFLALQSHMQSFKSQQSNNQDGLTTWQTLQLMSQATQKYSNTKESIERIQEMLARIMINTHTLTTPTLDPLGLCLEPLTALLNHSCTPNAHLVFDGRVLSLRSLVPIPKDTGITISYVDTTNPTEIRRQELQCRYFFKCDCWACTRRFTNGKPEETISLHTQQFVDRAVELQNEASTVSPVEGLGKLKKALSLLRKQGYSTSRQPYPALLHSCFLTAVACEDWVFALITAVQSHLHVEPMQYLSSWHPIRVVRQWVLLRLVVHIASLEAAHDGSIKALETFYVNWMLISKGLWQDVSEGVMKSHGVGKFSQQIAVFGEEMGIAGPKVNDEELVGEFRKLEKLAEKI